MGAPRLDRFRVSLVLTHACNLACSYCYMGEHHVTHLDTASIERALDLAFQRARHVDLGFFGGEPLIAWEALVTASEYATSRAAREGATFSLQVTTNATLLTSERARWLADHGVVVAVSLDGDRAAHDAGRPRNDGSSSFQATLRGVEALRAAGHAFDVIAVTSPHNVRFLAESVRFLASLEPRRLLLSPAFEGPWSDEAMNTWESELGRVAAFYEERWRAGDPIDLAPFEGKIATAVRGGEDAGRCSVGRDRVAVTPRGNLYPCERLVGDDRSPKFVIGTLAGGYDDRLEVPLGPADLECGSCEERFRCGASCACANVAETGEPHLPGGVQCWYEKTVARLADGVAWALLDEPAFTGAAYGVTSKDLREGLRRLPLVRS